MDSDQKVVNKELSLPLMQGVTLGGSDKSSEGMSVAAMAERLKWEGANTVG